MSNLTLIHKASIAHITISRAEKRNAFTQEMWQDLYDICEKIDTDHKPKVTIVQAESGSAFSAGADIQELRILMQDNEALKANNAIVIKAQQRLERLESASIALIEGACVGGGLGIALACDFRICTTNAKFAITPAKLGLIYSIEDTRRLVSIVGVARAKEMLLMGRQIDAKTALAWGLVNEMVTPNELNEARVEWASKLSQVSSNSIGGLKQTIGFVSGQSDKSEQEIRSRFDEAFTHADFKEGAAAFLQKRPARF